MSYLDRISECNRCDPSRYVPFTVAGARMGWVRRDRIELLAALGGLEVTTDGVHLPPGVDSFGERTRLFGEIVERLTARGEIDGLRGERYPVKRTFGAAAVLEMERAAIPYFGVPAWGVHVNGFVRVGADIHMWVAHRSRLKPTYPGKLDNMVAGGQPSGISLRANVVKESAEEASIPESLAALARPVGVVSYRMEDDSGLKPDCMFCFDLELPAEFVPHPGDDEVESFRLLPIEQVADIVRDTGEFKLNCNLVIIDFLLRHGLFAADDPDYELIASGLHGGERA